MSQSRISLILQLIIILISLNQTIVAQLPPGPQFDNEIQGKPEIECGLDSIFFKVDTMKGTPSAIYVKDNMQNSDCRFHNVENVSIPLHKCNMRKKREINPNGIAYSFIVVVQLHPLFITKVDRAYNVNCFYMETQKEHSVEIGVSDIAATVVTEIAQLPECTYTIHRDSPHGPVAKFAHVGQMLFHVWECPSTIYSMLLHSCEATDGAGESVMVINDDGCPKDSYIMPQITYNDDLTTAMVESPAFIFPDRPQMRFNCQIQLCSKNNDCSEIMPPKCNSDKAASSTNEIDVDLEKEGLIPTSATITSASTTSTVHLLRTKAFATPSMPLDFPRPRVLPLIDEEGSGEIEDDETFKASSATSPATTPSTKTTASSTTTTSSSSPTTTQTIQILKKGNKNSAAASATAKSGNRLQRHSPPNVNFDIQSPELLIMDDHLDPNDQYLNNPTSASKQLYSDNDENSLPKFNDKICVPLFGFYAVLLFILFFSVVVLVFLIKSRKTLVHKFY